MSKIIQELEKEQIKKNPPDFSVGDLVRVYSKITEGDKERTSSFEGIVLKKQGKAPQTTFTVRKIVQGIGVEKTYPFYSPRIEKISVIKKGKVRRAKLFYLRERVSRDIASEQK